MRRVISLITQIDQEGGHETLQVDRAFVIYGVLLVVQLAVAEDAVDVIHELLLRFVLVILQLPFNRFDVDRLLYNQMVVGYVFDGDRFQERPGRLVLLHLFENVQALNLEAPFFRLL